MRALRQVLADNGIAFPRTPGQALRQMLWNQFRASRRRARFEPRPEAELAPERQHQLELYQNAFRGLVRTDSLRGGYLAARGLVFALDLGAARYAGIAPDDHAGYLTRVYRNMLDRPPDPGGSGR